MQGQDTHARIRRGQRPDRGLVDLDPISSVAATIVADEDEIFDQKRTVGAHSPATHRNGQKRGGGHSAAVICTGGADEKLRGRRCAVFTTCAAEQHKSVALMVDQCGGGANVGRAKGRSAEVYDYGASGFFNYSA